MKVCMVLNSLPEAAEQAEKLANLEGTPRSYLRAASIRVHLKEATRAKDILCRGITLFPGSTELQRAWEEINGGVVDLQKAASR